MNNMFRKKIRGIVATTLTVAVLLSGCGGNSQNQSDDQTINVNKTGTQEITTPVPTKAPKITPAVITEAASQLPEEKTAIDKNSNDTLKIQEVTNNDIVFINEFVIPEYSTISQDEFSVNTQSLGTYAGDEVSWYSVENFGIAYFYYQPQESQAKDSPVEDPQFSNFAIVGDQYTLKCGIKVGMTKDEIEGILPNCVLYDPAKPEATLPQGALAWNNASFPDGWCEKYSSILMANINYGEELPWYIGFLLDENDVLKAITTCYPTAD